MSREEKPHGPDGRSEALIQAGQRVHLALLNAIHLWAADTTDAESACCEDLLKGGTDKRSVEPRCPACPPGRLPEGWRRHLFRLAHAGSVEGGRLELCKSFTTSASSSTFLRAS